MDVFCTNCVDSYSLFSTKIGKLKRKPKPQHQFFNSLKEWAVLSEYSITILCSDFGRIFYQELHSKSKAKHN